MSLSLTQIDVMVIFLLLLLHNTNNSQYFRRYLEQLPKYSYCSRDSPFRYLNCAWIHNLNFILHNSLLETNSKLGLQLCFTTHLSYEVNLSTHVEDLSSLSLKYSIFISFELHTNHLSCTLIIVHNSLACVLWD
jgi:hypothetical protein